MKKNLLFIQLNEINFDVVDKYVLNNKNLFPKFAILKDLYKKFKTKSEVDYKNLEPWIQWPSIYLGKKYKEHKIFRLGDIVNNPKQVQLFEKIEQKGFKVGSIAPMNAENRLIKPSYFIPDPWTDTKSDISIFSKRLTSLLKQSVNQNSSGKLSFSSILTIIQIIIKTFHLKRTTFLIKLILTSFKKPWIKALVLDYLLHMIHLYLYKKKKPNFSSIFLNAGAHIQHHYFFNIKNYKKLPKNPDWYISSSRDPFEDMLKVYEKIIGDYIDLSKKETNILIATALRQVPYNSTKFYYRLKDHNNFLNKIGIKFSRLLPRMTRDFEIIFNNTQDLNNALKILKNIKSKKNNIKVFNEIEKRKKSLFVTLTYPREIKKKDFLKINQKLKINFYNEVSFVGVKNGMHDSKGYVFCSPNSNFKISKETIHVSKLYDMILSFFK
tara:strand:- start:1977 stop:3290 length:1314 start_codon:yes stop_codon:yes gene_type:complete